MITSSRRDFIKYMGQAALMIPGIQFMTSIIPSSANAAGSNVLLNEKIPAVPTTQRKLGVALVGLGKYSTEQLAPALQETRRCRLAGIVTGTPDKAAKWQATYNIPEKNVYTYENFDSIKDNPDIDIVYVVLPNAMHAEFTIRAAKAGKHVICEKPMAVSVQEGEDMIEACREADRLLSIGYRLHFEPHNIAMAEFGQNKTFGDVKKVIARDGMDIEPNGWRLSKTLAGGGPLMDLGIYCVQGAIYTAGDLPIAVTAKEGKKTDAKRFREVEQSMTWIMEFPNGAVAECETSYAKKMDWLRAEAEEGWFELEPAFGYDGIRSRASDGPFDFPQVREQVLQMDDFALCINNNKKSKVSGEMGLRDLKVLSAIYESARTGKKVRLSEFTARARRRSLMQKYAKYE